MGARWVDWKPPHSPGRAGLVNGVAPISGLALGALGCGALVQFAPAPTRLVFALLLVGTGVAAVVVAPLPPAPARRPRGIASLTPALGVPARPRPPFSSLPPLILARRARRGPHSSPGP